MYQDHVFWITGASSGIGAAFARQLAKQGAYLILSGRNVDALGAVAAKCGVARCLVLPFETTDYDAIPALVDQAWGWRGQIDGLINNAGISQRSLALETAFPVYQKVVDVDLLAPIALTQEVLPRMVARKSGRLVFISSVAGKVGSPMRTAYSAAKHGLIGYADALRVETAALGLQVHVIAPGSIRTDVSRNAIVADGSRRGVSDDAIENGMDPDKAAKRMLRAMARGDREIIIAKGVEQTITRLRRKSPNKLFDLMEKMMAAGYAEKMKGSADPS
jgi:dehydrogenase/reductase SDR family protein 7B